MNAKSISGSQTYFVSSFFRTNTPSMHLFLVNAQGRSCKSHFPVQIFLKSQLPAQIPYHFQRPKNQPPSHCVKSHFPVKRANPSSCFTPWEPGHLQAGVASVSMPFCQGCVRFLFLTARKLGRVQNFREVQNRNACYAGCNQEDCEQSYFFFFQISRIKWW